MINLRNIMIVGAGGASGAVLRFLISRLIPHDNFPLNTLLINIAGSFLSGLILAVSLNDRGLTETSKLFLATGFCGGFTTFSAFSTENVQLLINEKYFTALLYILASIAGCLVASFAGFKIAFK